MDLFWTVADDVDPGRIRFRKLPFKESRWNDTESVAVE